MIHLFLTQKKYLKFFKILFLIFLSALLTFDIPLAAINDSNPICSTRASNQKTLLNETDASFYGEDVEDHSGWSISKAFDVNGDGLDDFLVGAPGSNEGNINSGKCYLLFGKESGWYQKTNLEYADASFFGANTNDYLGKSVSGAGDSNKDGYNDILLGAPGNDVSGTDAGTTYLIMGKSSGWKKSCSVQNNTISFPGINPYEHSGHSVSGGGDVNGDGYDDFIIGAPGKSNHPTSSGFAYLLLGGNNEWSSNFSLSNAEVQFNGEELSDHAGYTVSISGDVNGDGLDDIMIGAPNSSGCTGKTYLIFGKSDWTTSVYSLADSDVTFHGEKFLDYSGISIAGAGDVNNDGFDDILIGAKYYDHISTDTGKTYLIFGKRTGWSKTISLSESDISFIGEGAYNRSGASLTSAGDINSDGCDDFLIGAPGNHGTAYLIYGRRSGWEKNNNLKNANVTYISKLAGDKAGAAVAGIGDVNGDCSEDILVGAWGNEGQKGYNSGQTYLIFQNKNFIPTSIEHVKFFKDENYVQQALSMDIGETCYIELKGTDGNQSRIDATDVKVWGNETDIFGINVRLFETENNSGIYRGNIRFENVTHRSHGWIASSTHEKMFMKSIQNPLKFNSLIMNNLPKIILKPEGVIETLEDQLYQHTFEYTDRDNDKITWTYKSNASWLNFEPLNQTLYGTPTNDDVGTFLIKISIKDGFGGLDEFNYTVKVLNVNDPPVILKIDDRTPVNDTIEFYAIEDEWLNFTLVAKDIDINDTLDLFIDNKKVRKTKYNNNQFNLSFYPTNDDVGIMNVTIEIWDNIKPYLNDTVKITIFVNNTNDPPIYLEILDPWEHIVYSSIDIIDFFGYCFDPDLEVPNTDEKLNFTWYSDIEGEFSNLKVFNTSLIEGTHNLTFKVQDKAGCSNQTNIFLEIASSDLPRPSLGLVSPIDGKIFSNGTVELEWDPEPYTVGELLYDIYIDTKIPPLHRVERNYNGTKYIIENLSDHTTYYWTVVPRYRGHCGNCADGNRSFSINSSFDQSYDIFLSSELMDNIINMNPGKEKSIDIWVFNTGNCIDLFELNLFSDELNEHIEITHNTFILEVQEQEILLLTINLPSDFAPGNYSIKITVRSMEASKYEDLNVTREMDLIVLVEELEEDEPTSNDFYIYLILIAVLIVVVIGLYLLYRSRLRKKKDNGKIN